MKKILYIIAAMILAGCGADVTGTGTTNTDNPVQSSSVQSPSSQLVASSSSASVASGPATVSVAEYDIPSLSLTIRNVATGATKTYEQENFSDGTYDIWTYENGAVDPSAASVYSKAGYLLEEWAYTTNPNIRLVYPMPYKALGNVVTLGMTYTSTSSPSLYSVYGSDNQVLEGYLSLTQVVQVNKATYGSYSDCIKLDVSTSLTFPNGFTNNAQSFQYLCRGVGLVKLSDDDGDWVKQ